MGGVLVMPTELSTPFKEILDDIFERLVYTFQIFFL